MPLPVSLYYTYKKSSSLYRLIYIYGDTIIRVFVICCNSDSCQGLSVYTGEFINIEDLYRDILISLCNVYEIMYRRAILSLVCRVFLLC